MPTLVVTETLRPVHLNDIASCAETVVAVGDDGAVSVSNDRAQSWKNVENAFDGDFLAVAFSADCSHVVAAGTRGILLESSNGGTSWSSGVSVTRNTINSVAINKDGTTRVAVGRNGLFIASSHGTAWQKMTGLGDEIGSSVALSDDGQAAVVASRHGSVQLFEKKQNGEFTLRSKFDRGSTRFKVVVVDDRSSFRAFAFGENRAILAYANQGWRYVNDPDQEDRRDIVDVAVHGGNFLAVGDGGLQMASIDGRNWNSPKGFQGNDLTSIAINGNGTAAVSVGADGTILFALTDRNWWAGSHAGRPLWKLISVRTTSEFSGVTFVAEDKFAVVGEMTRMQGNVSEQTSVYLCDLYENTNQLSPNAPCVLADGVGKIVREERMESASGDGVDKAVDGGDNIRWWADETFIELLQNNVIRLGTIMLFLFMASHLFRLARYYSRLAAYYRARADAFALSSQEFSGPSNMAEMEQAMLTLSPDHLETRVTASSTGISQSMLRPLPWFK